MALEDLSGKVSELAQTGVAKAKELFDAGVAKTKEVKEIARLKMENASEQEAMKKAYLEIGKLYFAERGEEPEAAYAALCERVVAAKAKVAYNLERISDIKAASNLPEESESGLEEDEIVDEIPVEGASLDDEAPAEETPCCCCQEDETEDDKPADPQA